MPRPPTPPVPPQSPKPQPSPAHPPIGHTIKPRPKHEPPKQVVPRPIAKAPTGEQPASEVHKTGVPEGKMVERGMTRETYAAIVNAEINAHRFYPESARAAGITGRVVVAFAIGASGTAAGITIVSSSGNAGLDDAARQAVRAVHAPPPPGGSFSASKTFSFSLH
ncbi:MAG: energy transducer TonB [Ancalomicrobiaceae bacterium]|nr:energy transducer TonB [Ancalomicrobiaceae bacterium]